MKQPPESKEDDKSENIQEIIVQLNESKAIAEREGDNKTAALCATMLGLTAILATTYSPNAEAANLNKLVEQFAKKISETLAKQLGPMFEQIMGIFMNGWGAIMNQEGDKTTEGLAKVGDSINQVNVNLEKDRLQRATAPRHDACTFDDNASNEIKASEKAAANHAQRIERSTQHYFKNPHGTNPPSSQKDFGAILTSSSATDEQKRALLDPSILNKDAMTASDVKSAVEAVDLLSSKAKSQLMPIVVNDDTSFETRVEVANTASKAIHIELANSILLDGIAKREIDSSTGESEYSLLKSQITKTYYSDEWRKVVQGYGDPTPVLIDICMQTATSNKLLFDSVRMQQDHNKLLSAVLLKMNERA